MRSKWRHINTLSFPFILNSRPTWWTFHILPDNVELSSVYWRTVWQLRLVAANGAFTGAMGGMSGADHACYRQARRAGMRSTFRAFIAGRVQDIHSIIHRRHDRRLPVVNAKVCRVVRLYIQCGNYRCLRGFHPPPLVHVFNPLFCHLCWPHTVYINTHSPSGVFRTHCRLKRSVLTRPVHTFRKKFFRELQMSSQWWCCLYTFCVSF